MSIKGRLQLAVAPFVLLLSTGDGLATSLEETIQAALETNPEVGVVQADRSAIDQELRQARAQYFPSVDVRGAVGPEYSNNPSTRNRATRPPGGDSATTLMRYESQLTLSQMLFDGFATPSEVERQKARIDSASYRVAEAAEFIALDAVEAHLDVLRNLDLVELARENVAEHRRILDRVERLESEGGGSIADVRQTEARVASAESALATAIGNLRDAQARYISVVGTSPESLEPPLVPLQAVPESGETAAVRASVNSPTVQIANADIDVSQAELQGSRAGYYPRLDLELGTGANRNIDGVRGGDVDAQALLVVRYNLSRGGADVAREREAFERLRETREQLRLVRREAEEEARLAYNAVITARSRVEALGAEADAQRATRDAYAQQFILGQRTLLDLLDAENQLFIARSNLTTAVYTERFAVYRVLTVLGDLLVTLDIDRPKESINVYRARQQPIQETSFPTPAE